ncbi:hypothetical protein G7Y89_g7871 [Cudoniella acicularis]|uniref:DUF7702 domain-containing protein n=1 Tax=Cudoniella acicularis TaxID=354080 RepID=A0A8H4W446_9HELO|nr:hypothetical protein G7Y89_g7871 [Cudoniella acicularis]
MSALDKVQLAIYLTLSFPTIYILIRHGRPGILGWFYILAFCSLRIVGGALSISADNSGTPSTTAATISSIGLSPLLIGISGILHEANAKLRAAREWPIIACYHFIVITGLALIVCGSSAFKGGAVSSGTLALLKVGIIVLLLAWVVLIIWGLFSLLLSQRTKDTPGFSGGTMLLYAVLFSLPFASIRVLYSVLAIVAPSKNLNLMSENMGLKIGLSFIPELIAVLGFVFVGLATHNLRKTTKGVVK